MLPPILNVAIEHGLQRNERSTHSVKDVRFKCPFCEADAQKNGKYYLSLNTQDNVFKCFACGESGGVLQFIAMLEKISLEEVKVKLWGKTKSPRETLHPAERLTPSQLKALGIVGHLGKIKHQGNPEYYLRTLNWVWQEWLHYVAHIKELAYIGLITLTDSREIQDTCQKYAQEINLKTEDLLLELTRVKFSHRKPDWAKAAEAFVAAAKATERPVSPDREAAGREKEIPSCLTAVSL